MTTRTRFTSKVFKNTHTMEQEINEWLATIPYKIINTSVEMLPEGILFMLFYEELI